MLRIGLLGASRIAPRAVIEPAAARDDVAVTAVGARSPDKARAYAAEHGIAHVCDYDGLIAHPQVDLVYIALPPSEHLDWTRRALEAGKGVLVEKPFAMTGDEAQAMVEAADRAGRPLLEAFHYRFHDAFARAQAVLAEGRLGELRSADAVFDAPIAKGEGELRWVRALGGGALMDLGCYALHALRTLLGEEPHVLTADCDLDDGVDAATRARLRFGAVEATLACDMRPAARHDALTLVGDRGRLEFTTFVAPHREQARLTLIDAETGEREALSTAGVSTYAAQLAHVVEVMAGRATPLTGGVDAVAQARAMDAIYALGRP